MTQPPAPGGCLADTRQPVNYRGRFITSQLGPENGQKKIGNNDLLQQ